MYQVLSQSAVSRPRGSAFSPTGPPDMYQRCDARCEIDDHQRSNVGYTAIPFLQILPLSAALQKTVRDVKFNDETRVGSLLASFIKFHGHDGRPGEKFPGAKFLVC